MAAKILFRATENLSRGPELWVTDGTYGGTYALKDSGVNYVLAPLYLTYLGNGKMVFSAYDSTNGQELWVTDGTSAGTHLLTNINPGSTSSSPGGDAHSITYLGGGTHKAVFTAEDGKGLGYGNYDLWVTDGATTSLLKYAPDPNNPTIYRVPYNTHDIAALGNGKALFDASDNTGNYGDELWVTDGTGAGTRRISDIYSGFAGSNPRYITPIGNGRALFAATDGNSSGDHGTELWIAGSTPGGAMYTTMVQDINLGPNANGGTIGSYPHHFTPLGNGEVVFSANSGNGYQLFVTDGTAPGTAAVLDNNSAKVNVPYNFAALGNGSNKAVFASDDGVHGTELWVTDGVSGASHTYQIADINAGPAASTPHDITALGDGRALFAASSNSYTELWITDGTTAGTTRVTDASITSPLYITPIGGGEALFQATYRKYGSDLQNFGTELFLFDGGSAHLVKNIYPDTISGGTVVTTESSDPSGFGVFTPVCFCRGTLIRTDRGEVPVEALAVGDTVETLSGALRPIRWIGFGRDLVTAKNPLARPIIVRRGALADNVPKRDLYLTHGHALYIDGVLVPVELLVNHRSILWDDAARVVEYYHIELDGHDVVIAEGAPAESYHDAGNRALFQNARPGSEAGAATPTYAPVLNGGAVVKKIWAALFERAGGSGDCGITDDPDLHLVIDGQRWDPAARADGIYAFVLDRPPTDRLLVSSRSCVPSLMGTGQSDHRKLGVAIKQVVLHGPGVLTCLDHDALFALGRCYAPESGYCWTDGALELPPKIFAHMRGAFTLVVQTRRHRMRYPLAAAGDTAAAA